MTEKKYDDLPSPESLGIPSGSLDPIKTIQMEGDFYRGLVQNTKNRPLIQRIFASLFGIIFFIMPGFLMLCLVLLKNNIVVSMALSMFMGILSAILFVEISQATSLFVFEFVWILYALLSLVIGLEIVWKNVIIKK